MYVYIYIYTYTYVYSCVYIYIYIYIAGAYSALYIRGRKMVLKIWFLIWHEGVSKKPNRNGRTEPNRTEPFNSGTGWNPTRNRTGPSHDASEKCRPNRVEPGQLIVRTEPNRTEPNIFRKVRNRNKPNRTGSFLNLASRYMTAHDTSL